MKSICNKLSKASVAAIVLLLVGVISCSEDSDEQVTQIPVAEVSVGMTQGTANTLELDKTLQLTVTIEPKNATNKQVEWRSSDPTIATVETGQVTGITTGTVDITAISQENNSIKGKVTLEIIAPPVTGVSITPLQSTMEVDKTLQLTAVVTPEKAANKQVTWSSSNEAIATVDATGIVTSLAAGTVEITATSQENDDIKGKKTIEIVAQPIPVTGVSVGITQDIKVGETLQLTATVTPENTTNPGLTWTSNPSTIATVDQTGRVTGVAVGEVTITATSQDNDNIKDEVTLNIEAPDISVTGISIDASQENLEVGETLPLSARVIPENATNQQVVWTSSSTDIATVDETGRVTGVAVGEVTITATSQENNNIKDEVTLNVEAPAISVTGISIDASQENLEVGETLPLTAVVTPENATNQQVVWTSNHTDIATVDETGRVTGKAVGEVTITATSQDNNAVQATKTLQVLNNTISPPSFSIDGLDVAPTILGTEITFEVDFNKEGKNLDVSNLALTITHPDNSIDNLSGTNDFRAKSVPYTINLGNSGQRTYNVSVKTKPDTEFITTWNVATIEIPTNSNFSYNYNIDINNDGYIDETRITGNKEITFEGEGRTVRISGKFPAIFFNGLYPFEGAKSLNISSLEQWGTVEWESMMAAFKSCSQLQVPATDVPDLSRVTDMGYMFSEARNANPDVEFWDTSKVTNMNGMFYNANNADPDVKDWDTGEVVSMQYMFYSTEKANPDVEFWDTSKVINMSNMFERATEANPNVEKWDTGKAERMISMFDGAIKATPNVEFWNTENVKEMAYMFRNAAEATPNVSNWDTSKVKDFGEIFSGASKADPDVSNWDISRVLNVKDMFKGSALSQENYDKALINFAKNKHRDVKNKNIGEVPVQFCSDEANDAKNTLESRGWQGIGDRDPNCN